MAQVSAAPVSGPKLDNRRVLAAIVDLLIVGVGAAVILWAGDSLSGDREGALGAVILGWALYYYFALESGAGQTVGKKLMKLRVVRADGRPAGMPEIAVRTILRVVDGIGMYIVGLIAMLVTGERRQRIGDLAASTIVVDASASATAVPEPIADAAEKTAEEAAEERRAEAGASAQTITLPSRPAPPATLSDLAEPEPAEEAEPVVEEPVVEEEALPRVMSASLEGLAEDVAAVQDGQQEEQPEEQPDEPQEDGPVTVKSVETVSAMDLIMGAAEEDASGRDHDDEGPVSA